MTDTTLILDDDQSLVPHQRKRRARRKRHVHKPKVPVNAPAEFAGMTELDCCTACRPDRCVISGVGTCSHPFKGGLQAGLATPAAVARFERAKKVLARRKIDPDNL